MTDRDTTEWQDTFARMSGHYLTAFLPGDWASWSDDRLYEFFEDNAWQPLEDWPTSDVYDQIASVTDDVMRLMKERGYA